jgi:hypothetical protein
MAQLFQSPEEVVCCKVVFEFKQEWGFRHSTLQRTLLARALKCTRPRHETREYSKPVSLFLIELKT